jgi:hypothetical protein
MHNNIIVIVNVKQNSLVSMTLYLWRKCQRENLPHIIFSSYTFHWNIQMDAFRIKLHRFIGTSFSILLEVVPSYYLLKDKIILLHHNSVLISYTKYLCAGYSDSQ